MGTPYEPQDHSSLPPMPHEHALNLDDSIPPMALPKKSHGDTTDSEVYARDYDNKAPRFYHQAYGAPPSLDDKNDLEPDPDLRLITHIPERTGGQQDDESQRFIAEKAIIEMPDRVREALPPVVGSFESIGAHATVQEDWGAEAGFYVIEMEMPADSSERRAREAEIEQAKRAPDTIIEAGVIESMVDAAKQSPDTVIDGHRTVPGDYWVEYELEDPESGTVFSGYEGYNDKGELKFGASKLQFPGDEDVLDRTTYLSQTFGPSSSGDSLRSRLASMSPEEREQVVAGANALLRHMGADLGLSDEPGSAAPISNDPSLQPEDPAPEVSDQAAAPDEGEIYLNRFRSLKRMVESRQNRELFPDSGAANDAM